MLYRRAVLAVGVVCLCLAAASIVTKEDIQKTVQTEMGPQISPSG